MAMAARGRTVKCVILDLDNTLWGGVIGDDGPLVERVGDVRHGADRQLDELECPLLTFDPPWPTIEASGRAQIDDVGVVESRGLEDLTGAESGGEDLFLPVDRLQAERSRCHGLARRAP